MVVSLAKVKRKKMASKWVLVLALVFGNLCYATEKLPPSISYSSSLLQMMVGLAATIVMIFVVVWLIKRVGYTGYNATNKMKIKGTLPLSPKEKLLLVEVDGETMLIGVAPGFVGLLKTLDPSLRKQEATSDSAMLSDRSPKSLDASDSTSFDSDQTDAAMANNNFFNNKLANSLSSSFAEKLKAVMHSSDSAR